jgi:hypothetical protein
MDDGPRWSENFPGFAWFVNLPGLWNIIKKTISFFFQSSLTTSLNTFLYVVHN